MTEESKIVVKKLEEVKHGPCGFCSQVTHVIVSPIDPKKNICFRCVHKINFQMGKIPAGAVSCLKCNAIAGFKIENTKGTSFNYLMTGRDFKGCIKYVLKEKAPSPRGHIRSVSCSTCKANIPRWMLDFTTHV